MLKTLYGLVVTLKNFFAAKITQNYQQDKTPVSLRFKGALALRLDEQGQERCVACKLCEVTCPAKAIEIDSYEDGHGNKRASRYDIDMFKCINCGMCEEACPVDAIVTTPLHHYHMDENTQRVFTKDKLYEIGKQQENIINQRILANKRDK